MIESVSNRPQVWRCILITITGLILLFVKRSQDNKGLAIIGKAGLSPYNTCFRREKNAKLVAFPI